MQRGAVSSAKGGAHRSASMSFLPGGSAADGAGAAAAAAAAANAQRRRGSTGGPTTTVDAAARECIGVGSKSAGRLQQRRRSVTLDGFPGLDPRHEVLLQSSPWWHTSHRLFRVAQSRSASDAGADGLKTALLNDCSAWLIACTFLMTIGFSSIALPLSAADDGGASGGGGDGGGSWGRRDAIVVARYAFVGMMLFSSMAAMTGVIAGTCEFVFLNSIPAMYVGRSLSSRVAERRWYEQPVLWLFASLATLGLGCSCGVFLLYDEYVFVLALALFCAMLALCAFLYHSAVDMGWKFKHELASSMVLEDKQRDHAQRRAMAAAVALGGGGGGSGTAAATAGGRMEEHANPLAGMAPRAAAQRLRQQPAAPRRAELGTCAELPMEDSHSETSVAGGGRGGEAAAAQGAEGKQGGGGGGGGWRGLQLDCGAPDEEGGGEGGGQYGDEDEDDDEEDMSGEQHQCPLCTSQFITFSQKTVCPDCRTKGLLTPTGAAVAAAAHDASVGVEDSEASEASEASEQEEWQVGAREVAGTALPKFWA